MKGDFGVFYSHFGKEMEASSDAWYLECNPWRRKPEYTDREILNDGGRAENVDTSSIL